MAQCASLIEPYALTFLRRPTVGFGAGAAHQHRALALAQAIGLEEWRDRLLVIDDGVGARPVRAPQAAIETQASNTRASGSQMSANGYGSRDSVQAPLTLMTAFLRLARSSTLGSSAHGCGGAGGVRGCRRAR